MRCLVTYKLGSGCKKLTFGCPKSKFNISNKDKKKCRNVDAIIVGKKRCGVSSVKGLLNTYKRLLI